MDQETYDKHKQTLADGKIAIIGSRTASTVEQLDYLRRKLPLQAGEDTARDAAGKDTAAAVEKTGAEALTEAEATAAATASQLATGSREDVTPKTLHDNDTAEEVASEGDIAPQAGTEAGGGSAQEVVSQPVPSSKSAKTAAV